MRLEAAGIIAVTILVPALAWQTHHGGTTGPETPALQGAGRWRYLAPLPHARSEVAVAEANGKIYVLGGYAEGFVVPRPQPSQALLRTVALPT